MQAVNTVQVASMSEAMAYIGRVPRMAIKRPNMLTLTAVVGGWTIWGLTAMTV